MTGRILKKIGFFLIVLITVFVIERRINYPKWEASQPTIPEGVLATLNEEVASPSGEYALSLAPYDDEGVSSFVVVVSSGTKRMVSKEFYRTRDTFYAMWDDTLDRVWVYSGDVGVYYWDIIDGQLVITDWTNRGTASVPEALLYLQPRLATLLKSNDQDEGH